MRSGAVVGVSVLLAAAGGWYAALHTRGAAGPERTAAPPAQVVTAEPERDPARPAPVPPAPGKAAVDMRARIAETVQREVVPLEQAVTAARLEGDPPARDEPPRVARELGRYLQSLEDRAVRQGQVTALEVEPGVEAIRRLNADPEATNAQTEEFLAKMTVLSQRLEASRSGPAPR